jgi:hypothetical protein
MSLQLSSPVTIIAAQMMQDVKKRGRPPLGAAAQAGASRQRRYRRSHEATAVRVETWVPRDVALFFRQLAQTQGIPLHRMLAAALEAAAASRPLVVKSEEQGN